MLYTSMANDTENLKKIVPIWLAAVSRVKVTQRGAERDINCPWHDDTNPSFQMYQEEDGTWLGHCQSCGVTKNIFQLIQKIDKISYEDAVKTVSSMATNVHLKPLPPQAAKEVISSLSLGEFESYHKSLKNNPDALAWLSSRGISIETAEQHFLGFVQKPRTDIVPLSNPLYDKGWIVFPEIRGKKIVAMKYRSIVAKKTTDSSGKNWNGFAQRKGMLKSPLYNAEAISPFEDVFIVEGEIDCLTMEQAGFCSVSLPSATPSMSNLTDIFMSAATRYLAGDTDKVGTEAMASLHKRLGGAATKTYILRWPKPYKDANEVFLVECKGDIENFKILVRRLMYEARKGKKNPQSLWTERGDQIKEEVVDWFWANKFAMKEINILAGYPDQGKGVLLASVVAKATTGTSLPGETDSRIPAEILWFSGEETVSSSTVPRIRMAGGDLTKVHFVRGVKIDRGASQEARAVALDSDVQVIRENIESRPETRMIIVDPINSYFGNGNKNSSQDVRRVFGALKSLAENCNVAVVLVDHFNKNTMQRALQRLSGSQDVGASPRAAWVVSKDDETPDTRHIACLKCNIISEEQKRGFEFKIVGVETSIDGKIVSIPVVEWGKLSTKSAEELISPITDSGGPDLKTAIAFYRKVLDAKIPRLQRELYIELEGLGVCKRTAKTAMSRLGISQEGTAAKLRQSSTGWWVVPKGAEFTESESLNISIKQKTDERHYAA